jgi:hypothetical protein
MSMRFKESIWDDSEPEYAPLIKKIRNHYIWAPSKKYRTAGYAVTTIRLEGTVGDGLDIERAAHCRALTREMLEWFDGVTNGREPGTWGWLIGRYLHDEYSSIHDTQPSTRAQYRKELAKIEDAIRNVLLSETDYGRMMQWKIAMQKNGRSVHYISKWFRHLGLPLSHGVKLGDPDCVRIKSIRSEMRIAKPPRRSTFATRRDINLIIPAADARGWRQLSMASLFRFELMLRGTDVYGEWEPAEDKEGGIVHNGRRWVKGLTWEMFDSEVIYLEKVISKTSRSMPEAYRWDLRNVPALRRRLVAIPPEQRIGPVIVMSDGLPPRSDRLTKQFKAIVRSIPDIPDDLRISDYRSGAITEAKSMVDPMTLRNAAQHTQISTTDTYVRGRSGDADKVVQMRNRK